MSSDATAPLPNGQVSTAHSTAHSTAPSTDSVMGPSAESTDMAMDMDHSDLVRNTIEVPSTPLLPMDCIPASQETIPSTEGPGSPMDADSFRTEPNDEDDLPPVIPSSQTPPPSLRQQPQPLPTLPQSQSQSRHLPPPRQPASRIRSQTCLPTYATNGYAASSQRSTILSPPGTVGGLTSADRDRRRSGSGLGSGSASSPFRGASEYVAPTPEQIASAAPDDLRVMLQASLLEHTRLKMETAHHKLQYNLLSMQADEDAKRAAVEHEMTLREVEALRQAESARQARREIGAAAESAQAKYRQLKTCYDELAEENETLQKRVKLAKRLIQQKEEETANLGDEKELLLNRLRENREHFRLLCSPGGLFHGAMTPKTSSGGSASGSGSGSSNGRATSPLAHLRATPVASTPRTRPNHGSHSGTREPYAQHNHLRGDQDHEPIVALLQALNQDTSAPNSPVTGYRPPPRHVAKHHRNVQSLSSLPTTPTTPTTSRYRGSAGTGMGMGGGGGAGSGYSGLLPSADLVPQTEPVSRFHHAMAGHPRYLPDTPTRPSHRIRLPDLQERRHSRESTISVEEDEEMRHMREVREVQQQPADHIHEELARQALETVRSRSQMASSFPKQPPPLSTSMQSRPDEEVFESQASQAASAMLRRDPRESFEKAAAGSSNTTDKAAKLQAKLYGGLNKAGSLVDKRKFSGSSSQGSSGTVADGGGSGHGSNSQSAKEDALTSPTKRVRVVPSLRDTDDSHHHQHLFYQQQQRMKEQEQQQQKQQQQQQARVGLGIYR